MHWHKYTKWIDISNGIIYRGTGETKRQTGEFITQEKRCEKCNKVKLRKEFIEKY